MRLIDMGLTAIIIGSAAFAGICTYGKITTVPNQKNFPYQTNLPYQINLPEQSDLEELCISLPLQPNMVLYSEKIACPSDYMIVYVEQSN